MKYTIDMPHGDIIVEGERVVQLAGVYHTLDIIFADDGMHYVKLVFSLEKEDYNKSLTCYNPDKWKLLRWLHSACEANFRPWWYMAQWRKNPAWTMEVLEMDRMALAREALEQLGEIRMPEQP